MKNKASLVVRVLLGLVFFGAGLAGLLNLAPPPDNLPDNMKTFMAGLMATKYFFPFLKGTETVCGALLISGFFVPLALVILAPITLNILLVHAFMAPEGLATGVVILIFHLFLAFFSPYSERLKILFKK